MFVVCTIPLRVIDMHILWGISPLKIFQIFYSWIPLSWINLNPIEYPLYQKLIQPFFIPVCQFFYKEAFLSAIYTIYF